VDWIRLQKFGGRGQKRPEKLAGSGKRGGGVFALVDHLEEVVRKGGSTDGEKFPRGEKKTDGIRKPTQERPLNKPLKGSLGAFV